MGTKRKSCIKKRKTKRKSCIKKRKTRGKKKRIRGGSGFDMVDLMHKVRYIEMLLITSINTIPEEGKTAPEKVGDYLIDYNNKNVFDKDKIEKVIQELKNLSKINCGDNIECKIDKNIYYTYVNVIYDILFEIGFIEKKTKLEKDSLQPKPEEEIFINRIHEHTDIKSISYYHDDDVFERFFNAFLTSKYLSHLKNTIQMYKCIKQFPKYYLVDYKTSHERLLLDIQEYIEEEEPLSIKYRSMQDWANADPKRAKIVVDIYLNKNKKSFRKALCFFINEKTNPPNDIEKARTILNTVKV
jgi:hypothetical protein